MSNHLKSQTSPYLLQHAENPVDWYPWSSEAFDLAKKEDKPIFLSIGYSTCHWCHVMAHESFEDREIADILNRYFVSIKVDKEERPDIDSIYMAVCQAFTGSGGWPTSIFMTADQKPFFAGTYFPKTSRHGSIGLKELLLTVHERWRDDRESLTRSAEDITAALKQKRVQPSQADDRILDDAVRQYKSSYDNQFGGFGDAPKFPSPHNLIFLMTQFQKHGDSEALKMAEMTLLQMYSGGMFDHIGYGFCRYSTDRYFLVPHFEKMLYDNALLILAYCKAYEITKKPFYKETAKKTTYFILSEMTSKDGAFFSAQDADSDGEEGKFYLFEPEEIIRLLGEKDGTAFNRYYGITKDGNFEGKSIPNLLHTGSFTDSFDALLPKLRTYRHQRNRLHTDDKILTSWNSLMIAALCSLYRISRNREYLNAAKKAQSFIERELCDHGALYVSFRDGKRGGKGFLDDYANFSFALLSLYGATLDSTYLYRADSFAKKAVSDFFDGEHGGFYLYGRENETLIFHPKESYDGAMPSGNSVMACVLVRLYALTQSKETEMILRKQLDFMYSEAEKYPAGHAMFLTALSDYFDPPHMITAVLKEPEDILDLPFLTSLDSIVRVLRTPTDDYPQKNQRTTFYVCRGKSCLPPTNDLDFME
ncbi:MAG: thioredoxin domain-containing protein [Clostridiaceae bacterium]|nr:thioredoxin domain-containing protein [Clostridiaceae bacterium]